MINYFKKKLHNIYINYSYYKIIQSSKIIKINSKKIDGEIYEFYKKLNKYGIIRYDQIKTDDDEIKYYLQKIKDTINNKDNFKKYPFYSEKIVFHKDTLVEKILRNHNLNLLIKNYIGDDAKLDFISLMITKVDTSNEILSEKWHYDNVGRRIKMFVYLNDNNFISTEYIKKTNNLKHNYYSSEGSRVSKNKIKKLIMNKEIFFPEKGKILIFDTNGFHRGNYTTNKKNEINEKAQFRILIKFEFSSKEKSNKFFNKSDIIGPRSTFFSSDFRFNECELIDQTYLTKIENNYFYDQKFSSEI